jgi:hypothetical protein
VHFEVDRHEFSHVRLVDDERPTELAADQVLLDIESFAFTANNITYAVAGDMLDYWGFFQADAPWGRIPVMGIGRVAMSANAGVAVGDRYFGFFPMADHHVVDASPNSEGFVDRAPHRARHAATYRSFNRLERDPAYTPDLEGQYLVVRGLYITSFLVDDFLGDAECFGASSVIVTSASSRTSIALAHRLRSRGDTHVVGVTSTRHRSFVESVDLYDQIVSYDSLESLDAARPSVVVDMSGNADVLGRIHRHFGDQLRYSCRVGATHWNAGGSLAGVPGPTPTFFFAPDRVKQRSHDWGRDEFEHRVGVALGEFLEHSRSWMTIERAAGTTAVERVYRSTLAGDGDPAVGHILTLSAGDRAAVMADDIPVAYTPAGGWTDMPAPFLATCTEPLVVGAPDLRGMWKVVSVDVGGVADPNHSAIGKLQRIEQAGDRLIVTAGRIVHDMRCDGTEERGVHDVAEFDLTTPVHVVATYEHDVHVLRPVGLPIEITRRLDGDQLVWTYIGFTARLLRVEDQPLVSSE